MRLSVLLLAFLPTTALGAEPARSAAKFEGKDTMLRPENYREWVFVGSTQGLRYDDGEKKSEKLEYKNVYIDPASYRAYKETGTFPEGTVFILETADGEEKKEKDVRGSFQKEFTGLSAAVKDKERFADGWAYFIFSTGPGKTKDKAQPVKKAACYDCHKEKGAKDNVFTQYYPVLKAAKVKAEEPSWDARFILLARPGVKLETREGEKIAPRTDGVARDMQFTVRKVDGDRLRVESRRQTGWIAKTDAVLFSQALAHFTEQLKKDPKDSHAYTARGQVYAMNNESDKALADFNEAIRLDSKATLAYYHRANLEYGKGQYDKALEDYNTVIRDAPGFDWAYHVRGWIFYRRQDYDKALADYETAIKLVPTESVFYRDRGNVALSRKDYDKAIKDYDKAIELEPTYVVPWHLRGMAWQYKKEYAKAVADYEKAVEIAGNVSYASAYLTDLALLRAGCPDEKVRDGEKALEAAKKAYALTKGVSEMAALAAAHAELGQFDKAIEWQEKAIATTDVAKVYYRERLKKYQDKKPYRLE